jgi:2,4-dienoyl-CoA reductase-like NADH-dependent reductase (Old Yellow Enzyme family)
MYSADEGHLTDFHVQHLGSIATRGAGLVMVEASAVVPEGRISKEDSGIWKDSQAESLRRIATYFHSQGKHLSLQLAHAGRKASVVAPWLGHERGKSIMATKAIGGWPDKVVGPSPIPWSDHLATPIEMSKEDIKDVVQAFAVAATRCVRAGVDSLEIHAAHGYLIHSFLSGASNTRTDEYGGSFGNRIRILMETVDAIRKVIPKDMPLFVRISATDWLDKKEFPTAWDVEDSIALAKLLYVRGVDLLDVSSGGNHEKQKVAPHNEYQVEIAERIKKELLAEGGEAAKLLISAVGGIADGVWANKILEEKGIDCVRAARAFLRNPGFAVECAEQLGVTVEWPTQYHRRGRRPAPAAQNL